MCLGDAAVDFFYEVKFGCLWERCWFWYWWWAVKLTCFDVRLGDALLDFFDKSKSGATGSGVGVDVGGGL